MKRFFKLTALVLAIAMMAVTLSSCRALDEAKEKRAVYTDDTYAEIECNGVIYRGIDTGNLSFITRDCDYGYAATTSDVPILLTNWFGDSANMLNDNAIFYVYSYHYNDDGEQEHKSGYRNYIREDKYDDVQQAVKGAKLDHYYLTYSDVIDYDDYSYEDYRALEEKYALLNDEATAVVNKALDSPLADRIKYTELGDSETEYETIAIFVSDKDMLLTDNEVTYYLLNVNGKYYFWSGNMYDAYGVYPISKDDSGCIKKLFDDYPGAVYYDSMSYYYDKNYYNYPEEAEEATEEATEEHLER